MSTSLEWCPCIDEQTRTEFAQEVVAHIQRTTLTHEPLTLISLGAGALKNEEYITQLLLDAGYSTIALNLIDILYTQDTPVSLAELEAQTALFEASPAFTQLGDLYLDLEKTDDPQEIACIEARIQALEKEIEIEQYTALCDQQVTLLHSERVALLAQSLAHAAPHAQVTITSYARVSEYCAQQTPVWPIVLYIDPDTRDAYRAQQQADLAVLTKQGAQVYALYHDTQEKKIIKKIHPEQCPG